MEIAMITPSSTVYEFARGTSVLVDRMPLRGGRARFVDKIGMWRTEKRDSVHEIKNLVTKMLSQLD
jgi:hypothetical protein